MQKRKRIKRNHTNIIISHFKDNINIYILVLILFIIGLSLSVIIVNKQSDNQKQTTAEYITSAINQLKMGNKINKTRMLKQSIIRNIIIVFLICTLGLTFFGQFFIYFIIFILGITYGYTTSSLMLPFNFEQSLLLFLSTIFFQNIIALPTLVFLCVEGIKCQRDFLNKKNIKYITARYSFFMLIGILALGISSIIEVYISDNLILKVIKYL